MSSSGFEYLPETAEMQAAIEQITEDDELPGLLELQMAISEGRFPHTMNAQEWAKKWLETIKEHPDIPNDEGAMIGWFANAIMAGFDGAGRMGVS